MDRANVKAAQSKDYKYVFAKTWGEIKKSMSFKSSFLIKRTNEITFWLPLHATIGLRKAIKKSAQVTDFTIREDKFNKEDWSYISQGLIARKADFPAAKLAIMFTKITKKNLPFIHDILCKAKIKEVNFHDCAFEENILDDFCKAIEQTSTTLQIIHLTTNNLTEQCIKRLQDVVSSVKKHLVLYQSEIRIVRLQSEIKNDAHRYIFDNIREIDFELVNPEDPRLCYAVKMSPSLTTVIFGSSDPKDSLLRQLMHWEWIQDALLANRSIRKIIYKRNKHYQSVFPTIVALVANNRIEEIEFDGSDLCIDEVQQLAKLIQSNKSLKQLVMMYDIPEHWIIDAIKNNANLKAIHIRDVRTSVDFIANLMQASPSVTSWTFARAYFQQEDGPKMTKLLQSHVKELHFNLFIDKAPWIQRLCEGVQKSTTLVAFSLAFAYSLSYTPCAMILRDHRTLKKLNLLCSRITAKNSVEILDALRDNPTLTSFGFNLPKNFGTTFVEFLEHNTSLKELILSFQAPDDYLIVQQAIAENKTIQKLSILIEESNILPEVLAKNESITTLTLMARYWDPSNVKINEKLKHLLENNTTISNITLLHIDPDEVVPLSTEIQLLVNRNKEYQINGINTTLQAIGTMAARPHVYLSLLPLELWSNIFKRIRFSSAHNDFGETFLRAML